MSIINHLAAYYTTPNHLPLTSIVISEEEEIACVCGEKKYRQYSFHSYREKFQNSEINSCEPFDISEISNMKASALKSAETAQDLAIFKIRRVQPRIAEIYLSISDNENKEAFCDFWENCQVKSPENENEQALYEVKVMDDKRQTLINVMNDIYKPESLAPAPTLFSKILTSLGIRAIY